MDSGLIFSLGVASGLLGGVGFILLLVCTDDYATAYFSAYWRRLGAPEAAINPEAQKTAVNSKETVSQQSPKSDSGERGPGGTGSLPGLFALSIALLLSGCASVGGGAADVQGSRGVGMRAAGTPSTPFAASPRTEDLPICGFEAPYLPDPCRLEVTPGEWLRISNPRPQETKKHSRWWWLVMALVTL